MRETALLPRMESPFGLFPEVETLFNRLFAYLPVEETAEWPFHWGLTTEEKEKEVVVKAEMPGFKPEEVKVELVGERLTIEAEHKEPAEEGKEEKRTYARRELTLPPEVELEKAEAVYRSGVLEVHFPRKPEKEGRHLEVKT
jgi:HSP20 family protein